MEECKAGIYEIRNAVTGQIYIGSSINMESRFMSHKSGLRLHKHGNPKLQNSWNKYGEDSFEFRILHKVPKEYITRLEQRYLDHIIKWGHDFNICKDATKAPIKNKIIEQYNLSGKLLNIFNSSKECANKIGLDRNKIRICARGTTKTYGGFIFIYQGDKLDLYKRTHSKKRRTRFDVHQYTKSGKYLQVFKESDDIREYLGREDISKVSKCINGHRYTAYGYQWSMVKHRNIKPSAPIGHGNTKPIYQYTLEGLYIKKFKSRSEAVSEVSGKLDSLRKALKRLDKTYKGFKWSTVKLKNQYK